MITRWPNGAKVAVMVTVAYELWADGRWPVYAPMAGAWPIPKDVRDEHSISWSRYGAEAGVWRLLDLLDAHGVRATVPTSALLVEEFPDSVLVVHQAGHEIAAHSWSQDVMAPWADVDAEREDVRRSIAALQGLTGARPVGWCSPRATASAQTTTLLAEAGCTWSGDHNDAELPYVVDTLDYALSTGGVEILNITVHAHVSGRPQMATMFSQVLDRVRSAGDAVWVATHAEVADAVLQDASAAAADAS